MKIGILFAGQGAQYEGMGKDLYDHSEKAKEIFDKSGEEIKNWCFYGSKETLRETRVTQPCIYTVTMAAYNTFLDKFSENKLDEIYEIDSYAGFSLGEYAALTAAGAIENIEKCNALVAKRGQLMHEAGHDIEGKPMGGMVATFTTIENVEKIIPKAIENGILQVANHNSPSQTVVAGDYDALERFIQKAAEEKIKAKKLSVGTAFHSQMMKPAAEELERLLLASNIKMPHGKYYSNVTGKQLEVDENMGQKEYLSSLMATQTCSTVRWVDTIQNMIDDGIKVFLEIGPGKTLSAFVRKISKEVVVLNVEDLASLEKTIAELIVLKDNKEFA